MAKSSIASKLLPILSLAMALSCRASNPQGPDSDLDSAAERIWYGADGSSGPCEPPAQACTAFHDDKDFVDLCVSEGFQAKTCGCALRCSGKLAYTAPNEAKAQATGAPGPCAPELAAEADDLLKARTPGGPLDRCLGTHLCAGMLGGCGDEALQASTRLREISRMGCEDHIVQPICRDGFADSLHCPEPNIALLSRTWSEFRSKDVAVKRCMRKVLCSDDKGGCNADHLRQAQAIKAAVDKDGCEYWLRQFCSLGGNAW